MVIFSVEGLARKAGFGALYTWNVDKKLANAIPRETFDKHVYCGTVSHMATSKLRDVTGEEYSRKTDFNECDLETMKRIALDDVFWH